MEVHNRLLYLFTLYTSAPQTLRCCTPVIVLLAMLEKRRESQEVRFNEELRHSIRAVLGALLNSSGPEDAL